MISLPVILFFIFGCSLAYGVPGQEIRSEPQLAPTPQLWPSGSFNPLCWGGNQTCASQCSPDAADPTVLQWELLLVVLEGDPFLDTSWAQLGGRQAVCGGFGHVVAPPLDEFHLLIQEVALPEVTERRVCAGGTQPYSGSSAGTWGLP